MSRWIRMTMSALAAALLLASVGAAEDTPERDTIFSWDSIAQKDWDAGADSLAGAKSAVMIFEKITIDERLLTKTDRVTIYRRIRILGDAGLQWADVNGPAEFETEENVSVFGRTVLPNGEEFPLKAEDIHRETVVKAGKDKVTQTRFSMPGVTDNCIIEYALKYPGVPSRRWLVQKEIPLLRGEFRWYYHVLAGASLLRMIYGDIPWLFPGDRPEYIWRNLPSRPPRGFPLTKDSTELLFVIDSVPAAVTEPSSLPSRALQGELLCYYGFGTLDVEYWSSLSSNFAKWFKEDYCAKTTRVKKMMAESEGESIESRARTLYEWVQANITNISYVDLEKASVKKGSAARRTSKQKYGESADDLLKIGYGTEENVNFLYCAMLRELGLDAKIAMVVDRNKNILEKRIHDWQFDRSLVAVYDSSGKPRFFSPGVPFMPYGIVPWFDEGATALIEGTQGTMVTVPASGPEVTEENEMYTLTVSPGEKTVGTAQARLAGHAAASVRGDILYADSSEYAESLKDAVAEFLPDGEVDSLTCTGATEIGRPLDIKCRLEFPPVEPVGDKILLKPLDYFVKRFNPFISAQRRTPIAFTYAYRRREAAQIDIPDGWAVEALPSDSLFTNRIGECGVQFVQFGNKLSVQRTFKLNAPLWRVDDYRDVRALFQAREDMSEQIVVLNKTSGSTTGP